MENSKVFCEECRDDVTYIVSDKLMQGRVKGDIYSYMGKEARCAICGNELYIPKIQDDNLKALYDMYRKESNIVSQETILAIPKKYAIGKRPLSLLLGWGEQTFSRYCDGDVPSKQYSEILQRIYDNPDYYEEILEQNKGNLKTSATYEKSKRALAQLSNQTCTAVSKIDLAISYILNQCEDITPLALQKALYYIQGFYYAFYGKFLFEEDCEAWIHGPVYREIYYRYRDYRFDPIKGNAEFDSSVFKSSEKAILDSVIKNICCYSGKVMEKFTHAESPWLSARGELLPTIATDRIIEKSVIGDYFTSVKEKYNMITPNDIKEYTKVMFEQI